MDDGVFIIMGVAGSGKSTVGILLAESLKVPFIDADDYHPKENIEKMKRGEPLEDNDREEWLQNLNKELQQAGKEGIVLACSALKETHRAILSNDLPFHPNWIYLHGSFEQIRARMLSRKGHFMPESLLQSQFETLQEPDNALVMQIDQTPEEIVQGILDAYRKGT